METSKWSLKASVVFPVVQPPIDQGVVEISNGHITCIHSTPTKETIDLGAVAILPGLVNTHTHLEFSNLTAPIQPPAPFASWVSAVVAERRRRRSGDADPEPSPEPIARGLQECLAGGTTLIGEISTWDFDHLDDRADVLLALNQQVLIPFLELLSPLPGPGETAALQRGKTIWKKIRELAPRAVAGFSPHSPYTTTSRLLEFATGKCSDELSEVAATPADTRRPPVAMHLAETREELDLLSCGKGPLVEMLDRIGLWDRRQSRRRRKPIDFLRQLWFADRALVVHGNYLDDEELQFLGHSDHLSLVYCPRTHRYFGHSKYPLQAALRHGVRVALGTDSRASNPDLSLWEEAKTIAAEFPDIAPEVILRMATINGAEALGMESSQGSLQPGCAANLCVVQPGRSMTERSQAILAPEAQVVGAMLQGNWVRRPPGVE